MSASWNTKWGARRVRHDPPTLAEAIAAAACFAEDRDAQIAIAAELMGVPVADARAEAQRQGRERGTIIVASTRSDRAGPRTVVVERRSARRGAATPGGSDATGHAPSSRPARSASPKFGAPNVVSGTRSI